MGRQNPPKRLISRIYEINLIGRDGLAHPLIAAAVPTISKPLYRAKVSPENLNEFGALHFADHYNLDRTTDINILIGIDQYWRFIHPNLNIKCKDLVAMYSEFGWILRGTSVQIEKSYQFYFINF